MQTGHPREACMAALAAHGDDITQAAASLKAEPRSYEILPPKPVTQAKGQPGNLSLPYTYGKDGEEEASVPSGAPPASG